MKRKKYHLLVLAMLYGFLTSGIIAKGQVNIREDSVLIPTYVIGAPNPMPRFYEGKRHQGVQRRVYPYPMNDNLSFTTKDENYHIIYLENKYIELGIMPGLGGRIYYAKDKTNDYLWFYRNNVVKPSLIGMVGFWISGGNAWGFPHHHGPNTVKAMDYKLDENPDGSKTVWISNTDQRHQMRILLGYTIFPNSSRVEMTIKPMNRTPVSNSFLFWANPAVHVDTTYQVIFPPSVQYVTQHAKKEMTTWPVADGMYNRFDYNGIDISWWKNVGVPSSFFSWDPQEDYFGGYDHGKNAGTVWVGNHHICPGMKFWSDGNNPAGKRFNDALTDNDGQYIELMAGLYTDNQPDYSWIQPYEVKNATMLWFPMRELGGLKYANANGALNMEVTDKAMAQIKMNTTSPHNLAVVTLKSGEQILLQKTIDISPERPFAAEIPIPRGTKEDDLFVRLTNKNGETLLSYKPAEHHPPDYDKPKALKAPAKPEDIKTIEELYLTGLRINQFYNASLDPMPYYQEALKRDPNDYRVNTQLGILAIKNYDWITAEKHLRIAVNRISANYTSPKNGEALYYLAVALRAQNKTEEAYDYFYKATWSSAWHTAAYYQLAEIDCQHNDFGKALHHLNRSIATNTDNLKALNLKAIVLRKLNRTKEALNQITSTLKIDMLNHMALNELYLLNRNSSDKTNFEIIMRNEVQSYIELATDYGNCGFYEEAIEVLARMEKIENSFPLLYYYLGYYWAKNQNQEKALGYYQIASQKPHNYCFPFRGETIDVFNNVFVLYPNDAMAHYYLGNLLYERQPERAIKEWEKSRETDASFYIVHRNLAIAYQEIHIDNAKAMASMEKAVSLNKSNSRLLYEMDKLYELNRVSPKKKYEFLKKNKKVVQQRSETLLRLITRTIEYDKFEEAIELLSNNYIPEFEGGTELQNAYTNAYLIRGLNYLNNKKYTKALADVKKVLAYPIGLYGRSQLLKFYYYAGLVYEKMGDKTEADKYFAKILTTNLDARVSDLEFMYYQGLALQKQGKNIEAQNKYTDMLNKLQDKEDNTFFSQFSGGISKDLKKANNYYLMGLAYQGLGKKKEAKNEYQKAFDLNPGHIWNKIQMNSL